MKLVIIEDNTEQAESLNKDVNHNICDDVLYIKSKLEYENVKPDLRSSSQPIFFIVDISLKRGGKDTDGLLVIEDIRTYNQTSIIVAYSAWDNYRSQCLEAGANFFFEKDASFDEYDKTVTIIGDLIKFNFQEMRQKRTSSGAGSSKTEFRAVVSHCNEEENIVEFVIENPENREENVTRTFAMDEVRGAGELVINKVFSLIVTANSDGGGYQFRDTGVIESLDIGDVDINRVGSAYDDDSIYFKNG